MPHQIFASIKTTKLLKKRFLFSCLVFCLACSPCVTLHAEQSENTFNEPSSGKTINFIIRLGQGGFKDGRSPEGKLGGGQLALDAKPLQLPIIFSISTESYTNSADPTHAYEISNLASLNLFYTKPLFQFKNTDYFVGGGAGQIKVPTGEENSHKKNSTSHMSLEAGVHVKPFKRFGFYGTYKYLYAKKDSEDVKVIDFNEHILLLGATYNFSL